MKFHLARVHYPLLFSAAIIVAFQSHAGEPVAKPENICSVQRELYVPHPAPGVASDVATYVGNGLRRAKSTRLRPGRTLPRP